MPRRKSSSKKKKNTNPRKKSVRVPKSPVRVFVPKSPVRVFVPVPVPYVSSYVPRVSSYVPRTKRPAVHSPPPQHQQHVHEHLNRVNYAHESELSEQDLQQRKLKANSTSYVPNLMHVSSNELAIPAPYLKRNGMRTFASV